MVAQGFLGRALRLGLGILLAFVGALTLGNAPYLLLGYGLSAFAVFALGLLYKPSEAVLSVFLGMLAGVAVDLRAGSIFTFVGIGAVVVRTLQAIVLVRLRRRAGNPAACLVVLMVGVFLAIAVGLITYGGSGIQPAFAVFDIVYLVPAFFLLRIHQGERRLVERIGLTLAVVTATLVLFVSAATFLMPAAFAASVVVLAIVGGLLYFPPVSGSIPTASRAGLGAPFVFAVALVTLLLASGPALGYAMRSVAYPLYGDSLAGSQWMQASPNPSCRQGNLAGAGTEANGVWAPQRLRVLSTCVFVSGVIEAVTSTSGPAVDGDFGMDLKITAPYTWILSLGSYELNGGLLHVEVVPSDQPTVLANLTLVPGDVVAVSGAWVLDTDHGWTSEIHPAWSIQVLTTA